jgi:predicted TIM-barrel fold metal-dependent hydrolase
MPTPSTSAFPQRFANLLDLARLPWFDVEGGHLTVVDPALTRAVDMHTHLALAYLRPMALDLTAAHDDVLHYLPKDAPLDLDVYVNKNFRDDEMARMKRDLVIGSFTAGGMRETHTVPNLVREMGELHVTQSVLLPIEMPWPLSDNTTTWTRAVRDAKAESRLVRFGSVHPYSPRMQAQLDDQVALGVRGIKVHPAVQMVRPDDKRAMKLYRMCAERALPVLWHCGPVDIEPPLGRYMSQLRHYERAIAENPSTTFVLGHSGALQMDEAVTYAKKYSNVWMELSSQSTSNIARLLDELGDDRLLFGSDWPFYHQAVPLAKVLMVTDGAPRSREKILYENAARLLRLTDDVVDG